MLKLLKENFIYTNDCIILATPMVLFFIFLQLYIQTFQYNLSSTLSYLTFFITLWIAISGCFAGWFYMVKKTLQFSKKTFLFDTDRITALTKLFICLFKGVGRFFLPFLIVIATFFIFKIIKLLFLIVIYNSDLNAKYEIISVCSIIVVFFISYWFIFWIPEIVYTYKNPFKTLVNAFKKAYISFKISFPLYLMLCLFGIGLHFAIINSQTLPFVYFLLLILSYYYILYSVLLVFRHYESNFIE